MMTVPYLFANKTHPVKLSKSTVEICLREKVTKGIPALLNDTVF